MKTKSIFVALTWCLAVCFGMDASAQNMQIATLQHGDNMKAFYGVDAFREAMDNALSGDLISLSSGQFHAPDSIGKAVIIQGAGMYYREWNPAPTVITEDLWIIMENENETGLVIEGISMVSDKSIIVYDDIKNFSLVKCKMKDLNFSWDGGKWQNENILVDRCYIYGDFWVGYASQGFVARNSYINTFLSHEQEPANRHISNCVILRNENYGQIPAGIYENNVIKQLGKSDNCVYYNNLYYDAIGSNLIGNGNYKRDWSFYDVFSGGNPENQGGYGPNGQNSNLALTDEAATTYLGTDGTQIGVYGGTTPFSITPSSPQIVKSEIAGQSNADGKLSVKITVEAGDN